MADTRIEKDSLGDMTVPVSAYWGAQTQRAVENFPISGYRFGRRFIRALGLIKRAGARTNLGLERLPADLAQLIERAADEVISNRAIEMAGGTIGSKTPVHPNDHVNMGQSSNDVIPTAIHVSAAEALKHDLIPALTTLAERLEAKATEFDAVIKIGRTHLQDATPIRLGQEFSGYAAQARLGIMRCEKAIRALRELAIGGTAVGTGINTHPEFGARVCADLAAATGIEFVEAANHFEGQAAKDAICEASGQLRTVAVSLSKIANDIRWLASGPRCGLGEITIPSTQPGSSIMPGKVNPVMSEMVVQVAAQVIAADNAVVLGARDSIFELNVMMPMIAHNFLESTRILAAAAHTFAERCVAGIAANRERTAEFIEQSLAMCTSLAPVIGYDKAAAIAKEAFNSGQTVRDVARGHKVLDEAQLDQLLDPQAMTKPS